MNKLIITRSIRHFSREKTHVFINVLGLGIGLGCVILIGAFILHEFSFDNYHEKASRIFRVIEGNECNTVYAMGDVFEEKIPEIESVTRIYKNKTAQVRLEESYIKEEGICFADNSLLNILDIQLIQGHADELLLDPGTIIISRKLARKYFHNQNPVGKVLHVLVSNHELELEIQGVFKDFPSYSSLQTEIICEISTAFSLFLDIEYSIGFRDKKRRTDFINEWKSNQFQTLLLLHPKSDIKKVENKCSSICLQHRGEEAFKEITLQPYNEIYMNSSELNNATVFNQNQVDSLRIFLSICLLILFIAIINYILISNADSTSAIKEMACHKVLGASRFSVIGSVLFRSVFLSTISLIPAIIFVHFSIPNFNTYFNKEIDLGLFTTWPYPFFLAGIVLITGICAGLYLGIRAWKINPTLGFKNELLENTKTFTLNHSLIIAQFMVFILLAVCCVTIISQYKFSINKDLGFDTDNIITLNLMEEGLNDKSEAIRNVALTNPNVKKCIPMSFMIPPTDNTLLVNYKDRETNVSHTKPVLLFSPGATDLLGIEIIEGNTFSGSSARDRANILINEKAAKEFNVRAGEKLSHFTIVGVTKDFHYRSLHETIKPILIVPQVKNLPYLLIQTNGKNNEVINQLKEFYASMSLAHKFECETLNERIESFYQKEKQEMKMLIFFLIISGSLSVMGLFGFMSLKLISKTKEIGIRKVNGAKTVEILVLLNMNYIKWIFLSFSIASPIAWYSMTKWLENFAYKTEISWWIFALSGIMALVIALLTVSFQSYKAASRNPVGALRYE